MLQPRYSFFLFARFFSQSSSCGLLHRLCCLSVFFPFGLWLFCLFRRRSLALVTFRSSFTWIFFSFRRTQKNPGQLCENNSVIASLDSVDVWEVARHLDYQLTTAKKQVAREIILAEIEVVVPWHELMALAEMLYAKISKQGGRPPCLLATTLRNLLLQQWLHSATCHGGVLDRGAHHVPL